MQDKINCQINMLNVRNQLRCITKRNDLFEHDSIFHAKKLFLTQQI